jgi:hypothetical protein
MQHRLHQSACHFHHHMQVMTTNVVSGSVPRRFWGSLGFQLLRDASAECKLWKTESAAFCYRNTEVHARTNLVRTWPLHYVTAYSLQHNVTALYAKLWLSHS